MLIRESFLATASAFEVLGQKTTVDQIVRMGSRSSRFFVYIYSGRLDLANTRLNLQDGGWRQDYYQSLEFWEPAGDPTPVVMTVLVINSGHASIEGRPFYKWAAELHTRQGGSILVRPGVSEMVAALPSGIYMNASSVCAEYENCSARGVSFHFDPDGVTLVTTTVMRFTSIEAASAAIEAVGADALGLSGFSLVQENRPFADQRFLGFQSFQVAQNGATLLVTGSMSAPTAN